MTLRIPTFPLAVPYPSPIKPEPTVTAADVHAHSHHQNWCLEEASTLLAPSGRKIQPGLSIAKKENPSAIKRKIGPLLTAGEEAGDRLSDALSAYRAGVAGSPKIIQKKEYRGDFTRDAILYRLFMESAAEVFLHPYKIPVFKPLNQMPPHDLEPYPYIDCSSFLLRLLMTDETIEAAHIDFYQLHHRTSSLLERIFLNQYGPVHLDQGLAVNDILLFSPSLESMRKYGADHYGRVVFVQEREAWIESKWGYYARPCISPLTLNPLEYGAWMFVARPKDSSTSPTPSHKTFEQTGYLLPTQNPLKKNDVVAAADRLSTFYGSPQGKRLFKKRF